ncbi:nicotinate-nucleotide adenylyltransferase [Arenicella xantha]|uniref:Multifunctional fusion protein n=1 Tax=Arenicella xantha TaxID=644221 RepID=A0A395JSC8_9GAMM|nr:nicotinate-nucleotide adenylyltransferase [Arenicella xantha]RBP53252.1 nicotinate-nucleotide adenylyltransferase [Arenicella xantha]
MSELIGLFGGTFDPVHNGHLGAVEQAASHLPFSQIHWLLSARPPHKTSVNTDVEHRFAMLQLALAGHQQFVADDHEVQRPNKSYTVDTVEFFKQQFPRASLIVIIGADSLMSLPSWHRYPELLDMSNWLVLRRPGYPIEVPSELSDRFVSSADELLQYNAGRIWCFEHTDINISSTRLRHELETAPGPLAHDFLPSAVLAYIREHQLYKIPNMNPEQIKDQVVEALENIKAQDIKVIDIADISDFADYMVVASGTSDTHVKALAREASDSLRRQGVKPLNEDGADVGEWVLVDFGDVVLHVMRPEVRQYYDLEKLWDEDVRALVKKHREQEDA